MSYIRRRSSPHKQMTRVIVLSAFMSLLLLGAGFASRQAHAQTAGFPLFSAVATTTGVNLREQPAGDGATVATLPVNARAIVMGGPFNDAWYWLDYNGLRGYTQGKYLVLADDKWTPVSTETPTSTSTPARTGTTTPGVPSPVATGAVASPSPGASGTPAASPTLTYTVPSTPGDYTGLWLGELSTGGNVRSGPGLDKSVIKGWWVGRRVLLYQAVTDSKGGVWYRVSEPPEDPMWVHSSLIRRIAPVQFEPARFKGRWVNVSLSQQIVTAYEDGKPVKVTLASTGKGKNETTPGVWKIYWRLTKQTMEGGNKASGDYYKLKDVPYPQYFQMSGEALHGTFWHDDFGRPHSHGCVNLSTPMAAWLYAWDNIGTVVYVHKAVDGTPPHCPGFRWEGKSWGTPPAPPAPPGFRWKEELGTPLAPATAPLHPPGFRWKEDGTPLHCAPCTPGFRWKEELGTPSDCAPCPPGFREKEEESPPQHALHPLALGGREELGTPLGTAPPAPLARWKGRVGDTPAPAGTAPLHPWL